MSTKLAKAVARLQAFADDPQANDSAWNIGDLRALLGAYREAQASLLAERRGFAELAAVQRKWRVEDYALKRDIQTAETLNTMSRELDALRAELRIAKQELDCTYGDTPGLIHCGLGTPCVMHREERLRERGARLEFCLRDITYSPVCGHCRATHDAVDSTLALLKEEP